MAANRRFVQKLIQANNKLNSVWVTFVRTTNRLRSYVSTFHKGPIMRKVFTSHDFITNMTLLNVCNVHQRNILLVTPWENSNLILMDSTFYCHLVCKPRLLFIHHSVTFYNIDYKVWVIDDDIQLLQWLTDCNTPVAHLLTWFDFNSTVGQQLSLCKVWDEITYPFPNFNAATVEGWEWISYPPHPHILQGMWLLIQVWITAKPC